MEEEWCSDHGCAETWMLFVQRGIVMGLGVNSESFALVMCLCVRCGQGGSQLKHKFCISENLVSNPRFAPT